MSLPRESSLAITAPVTRGEDCHTSVRTGKAMTVNQKLPDDLAGIREHSLFVKGN